MRTKFLMVIAAFATVAIAVGAAFGMTPADLTAHLACNVDWLEGFTAHKDGIALAMSAGGLTAPELGQEIAKKIRADIDRETAAWKAELQTNLETQIKDLDVRIAKGEQAGQGVADLKLESDKRSQANAEFIEKIEKSVQKHADELNARLEAIEKKAPESGYEIPNYGEGLTKAMEAVGFETHAKNQRAGQRFKGFLPHVLRSRLKDISVSGSTVYEPMYVPGFIGPGERDLRVRDLLPRNRTSQNQVFFVSETALTDNAGPQSALGAAKGETTWQMTVDSETVQTIAHFVQVPLQILDDLPGFQDYVNGRMMFLLDQEEEDQLLYGDDTGTNLNGLMTQATAFDTALLTQFGVTNTTDIDRLRAAISQVNAAEYPATGIVMHTYNWAAIELLKDADRRYIFAMPQDRGPARMWGLPVVATTAMTSPDFLVGAFALGAAIWDRQDSQIAVSTEDSDNFQKNLATIRAEERITLTVYRTLAFVEGDFANTIT